jgi:hypothetical protein
MRCLLLAVVLGAGCDSVWSVDRLYDCPLDDDDCDRLLDADDPCPADPGSRDDEDKDGVGDACDPNLALSNDRLLLFDGFTTSQALWMSRGEATWQMKGSALALTSGAVERMLEPNLRPSVELVIDASFSAEGDVVGAFVASKASTGIPLECRVEHHEAGDDLVMVLVDPATDMASEIARATGLPGSSKDPLRIYGGQLTNNAVRCRARYGDADALFVDWQAFTSAADMDTVGLRVTQTATAHYRSVTVFTTVP